MLGKEYVDESDNHKSCLNPVGAEKIDFIIPEEGEKVLKLVQLSRERNIDYHPSQESKIQLADYCERKGIENPLGEARKQVEAPMYNPGPPPAPYDPNFMGGGGQITVVLPPPLAPGPPMPYMPPNYADQQYPPAPTMPQIP